MTSSIDRNHHESSRHRPDYELFIGTLTVDDPRGPLWGSVAPGIFYEMIRSLREKSFTLYVDPEDTCTSLTYCTEQKVLPAPAQTFGVPLYSRWLVIIDCTDLQPGEWDQMYDQEKWLPSWLSLTEQKLNSWAEIHRTCQAVTEDLRTFVSPRILCVLDMGHVSESMSFDRDSGSDPSAPECECLLTIRNQLAFRYTMPGHYGDRQKQTVHLGLPYKL